MDNVASIQAGGKFNNDSYVMSDLSQLYNGTSLADFSYCSRVKLDYLRGMYSYSFSYATPVDDNHLLICEYFLFNVSLL